MLLYIDCIKLFRRPIDPSNLTPAMQRQWTEARTADKATASGTYPLDYGPLVEMEKKPWDRDPARKSIDWFSPTENLLRHTDGGGAPHHCSLGAAACYFCSC